MKKVKKNNIEEKAAPKKERLIYCGPNLPGGILQRYTVLKGGIPTYLSEALKQYPGIEKLLVPVTQLAKTEQAITTAGTPEHSYYQQVLQGGR